MGRPIDVHKEHFLPIPFQLRFRCLAENSFFDMSMTDSEGKPMERCSARPGYAALRESEYFKGVLEEVERIVERQVEAISK